MLARNLDGSAAHRPDRCAAHPKRSAHRIRPALWRSHRLLHFVPFWVGIPLPSLRQAVLQVPVADQYRFGTMPTLWVAEVGTIRTYV